MKTWAPRKQEEEKTENGWKRDIKMEIRRKTEKDESRLSWRVWSPCPSIPREIRHGETKLRPDDGGSNHLRNVGHFLRDYTAQHPSLLPQEPEISVTIDLFSHTMGASHHPK
jgi:hypothetical protein